VIGLNFIVQIGGIKAKFAIFVDHRSRRSIIVRSRGNHRLSTQGFAGYEAPMPPFPPASDALQAPSPPALDKRDWIAGLEKGLSIIECL
jgi:hypothetical protein